MGTCFKEPTIDDLLDDSLTRILMKADKVDIRALRSMLSDLAQDESQWVAKDYAVKLHREDRLARSEALQTLLATA